jgi:hypothetical protein
MNVTRKSFQLCVTSAKSPTMLQNNSTSSFLCQGWRQDDSTETHTQMERRKSKRRTLYSCSCCMCGNRTLKAVKNSNFQLLKSSHAVLPTYDYFYYTYVCLRLTSLCLRPKRIYIYKCYFYWSPKDKLIAVYSTIK